MESNWAAEHLQVIRTLMERSAIYRRTLTPVMIFNGVLGIAASVTGILAGIGSPRAFIGYWMAVGVVGAGGSALLIRRQSLKVAEPFWSPPARRVFQALLPPLFFGFVLGIVLLTRGGADRPGVIDALSLRWLPLGWVALYGCAFHSAGFFMPRGMKLFGWALVVAGSAACVTGLPELGPQLLFGHGIMGFCFGALHLAYGVYLYYTDQRRTEP